MCGRYTLRSTDQDLVDAFALAEIPTLQPRFNIAPSQEASIVRVLESGGGREHSLLRWGLVPHWASDPSIGNRLINARCESAAIKPSFRTAFRRRRCLVPCSGFYEWKALDTTAPRRQRKQPYYIRRADEQPFAFAGLWDHWRGPDDVEIESYTILTTNPNELMRSLHNRMPVILGPDDYELWLDPAVQDVERLSGLLRPYVPDELTAYRVSTHVNSPKNDDPSCIQAWEGV